MSVTRQNILQNATALQKYCDGVKKLKNEFTSPTTQDLGIAGPAQPGRKYGLRNVRVMSTSRDCSFCSLFVGAILAEFRSLRGESSGEI